MKRRDFIRSSGLLLTAASLPAAAWAGINKRKIRTAHIGVGGMGASDLQSISSHPSVEVAALVDVDATNLAAAAGKFPDAGLYSDYRKMFEEAGRGIDAVVVSTPDHTHAPASLLAMEMGKHIYCQKPLTHTVTEARAMRRMAAEKKMATQMGIQIHSFREYRSAVQLIQSGIIGKVHTVRAWSNKNWGNDGPLPTGSDPVPEKLDWNLWLGTGPERPYKDGMYHPVMWRKILDYGCGTLGDMGVHIFDTPYSALDLDVPSTVMTSCRNPNGFSHPERNIVTYEFPGTGYTTESLKWVWYDGEDGPENHEDFELPGRDKLPQQGSMFVGEKGRLLLPHWDWPKLIVNGTYEPVDIPELPKWDHYHQFIDACLGKDQCSAPFSYASRLSEAILLGVVANRFPYRTLHWNNATSSFDENEANALLDQPYRSF
jgi:predicted dehydrogenase